MIMSQQEMAQMESLDVDLVSDLRIGLRPSSAQYIRTADLAVARRCWFRGEREERDELKGRGAGAANMGAPFG
jgi:hypothetical protein